MKNENDLTFSFFILQVLRKINWHSGTRILSVGYSKNKIRITFFVRLFHTIYHETKMLVFEI